MEPSEPNNATIPSPGYPNTIDTKENDLKSNLMKTIGPFVKEMNVSFNEIPESANR